MKTKFINRIISGIPAAIAIICFLFFSSLDKDSTAPSASQCCTGYNITADNLKQFMLDSLNSIKFEGGVYSKADLLNVINNLNASDDSVYLLNTLVNCDVAQSTDLAITSKNTSNVKFVRGKHCHPCPNKPCCRNTLCVAKIKRNCINYAPLPSVSNVKSETVSVPASENR